MSFPALPPLPEDLAAWSANVLNAHCELSTSYTQANHLLGQHDINPLHYQIHIDIILRDLVPLLDAMERNAGLENLPLDWVHNAAHCMVQLLDDLYTSYQNAQGRCVHHIFKQYLVH